MKTEINARMNRLIHILEPALVAVLSVIVGLILLSVMLPLLGIMTQYRIKESSLWTVFQNHQKSDTAFRLLFFRLLSF